MKFANEQYTMANPSPSSTSINTPPPPPSSGGIVLTPKPHPFSGAVLPPKHARELTPTLVVTLTAALADAVPKKDAPVKQHRSQASDSSIGHLLQSDSIFKNSLQQQPQDELLSAGCVQYTVWITEAWRILGWAEPSAALFWEMATMYYMLFVASRHVPVQAQAHDSKENFPTSSASPRPSIPPILSCGSTGSVDSQATNTRNGPPSPVQSTHKSHHVAAGGSHNKANTASAKELPVWIVGFFLLLHTEEHAHARNVSGDDQQRYESRSSLGPRTRLHTTTEYDVLHRYLAKFLLEHIRKLLLMCAIPHNAAAILALHRLAATSRDYARQHAGSKDWLSDDANWVQMAPSLLQEVTLGLKDVERLNFCLQRPLGGHMDDPPLSVSSVLLESLLAAEDASSPFKWSRRYAIKDVEEQLRRHLEVFDVSNAQANNAETTSMDDQVTSAMASLSLNPKTAGPRPRLPKELLYSGVRGTTILLKPRKHSAFDSPSSVDWQLYTGYDAPTRLHDVTIVNSSDTHLYLLQPLEHVTIVACTDCTIVLGAVAGLLHIQDCERVKLTGTARRMAVSNSLEVVQYCFTPSPPLLVGDNRSCQLAPYNTYYDGLREDLLAAGLAARHSDDRAALTCASNKWKVPVELSKLEVPSMALPSQDLLDSSPKRGEHATDDAMATPVLLPASEFHILFIPLESESMRLRRLAEELDDDAEESQYCRNLTDILHSCPFRLPVEYERRVHMTAERLKTLHAATKSDELTLEQQAHIEEEMNQKFRDWLVTSGNLRQVLDLVHMEAAAAV